MTVVMLGCLTPAIINGIGGVPLEGVTIVYLFPGVGLLAFLWTWLTGLPGILALRRRSQQHWSETARRLHPHRSGTAVVVASLPGVLMIAAHLALGAGAAVLIGVGVVGALGALLGSIPLGLAIGLRQRIPMWHWPRILLGQPSVFYGGILVLMPDVFGWEAWVLFLIVVARVVMANLWGVGGLLSAGGMLPASEMVKEVTERLARDTGTGLRRVVVVDAEMAAAYALPFSKEILLTRGLVEQFGPAELEAILAHELDHLRESRWMTAARVVSSNSILPLVLVRPLMAEFGRNVIGPLILWAACMPLIISRWVVRHEVKADSSGAAADPVAYGRALLRMHELNLIPAVLTENLSHPNLYDRLQSCGATPDFQRPAAAASQSTMGVLTALLLGALGAWVAVRRW
jgi:Zn-dependent protease with chaperone function